MKKNITIFVLLCLACVSHAQSVKFQLGETNFSLIQYTEGNSEDDKRTLVSLSRNNKKLLTHTIAEIEADHNSMSIEFGDYKISDSTITFYSYWAWGGDAPISPFGGRTQTYQVQKDGKLLLTHSQLYIEEGRAGFGGIHKGVKFLKEKAVSESDKKLFREYISQVEKRFNAKFVYGRQSNMLMRELRKRFNQNISLYTKDWKKSFKSGFGYRK